MKKVIVTEAAGGIGAATVQRILREGHCVIAVDLPGSKMDHFIAPNIEILYAD
jgi:NAD(P)-dependent dehydrogenase (short-subunit alcohol dehydrogenase family)